jgi:hypothetical protein
MLSRKEADSLVFCCTYENGIRLPVKERYKKTLIFIHKQCCTFRLVQFYGTNCHVLSKREICQFRAYKEIISCPVQQIIFLCVR